MNIDYLREFTELGMCLNYSKAAKKLYISESSLSKHIAMLEKEFDAPLLNRSTSRVQLTEAGCILFSSAIDIIRLYDETCNNIARVRHVTTINVAGLYNNATALPLITKAVDMVNADGPKLSIAYQNYRHKPYSELLEEGKVDVVFTLLTDDEELGEGLERVFLFNDPMIALVKNHHPYARLDKISVRDLGNQVILMPVGSYSSEHGKSTVKDIFSKYGIAPKEKPVFIHSITELSTVPNEDAVLIMERSMLSTQPFTEDYHMLEIDEDDACFSFYAVYMANPEQPCATFIEALVQVAHDNAD